MGGSWPGSIGLALVLAAGYFLLGRLAFLMAVSDGSSTSIAFLPEGMALAFTVLFGPRVSPGIFVGQLALSVSLGNPLAVSAAFGVVNMVEGAVGGWLFWKWRIFPSFERPKDILLLLALSALVLQPFGALARVLAQMAIVGVSNIFHLSFYAWAGNVMGQLLLVPLVLAWRSAGFRFKRRELSRSMGILAVYLMGVLLFWYLDLGGKDHIYWISVFAWFNLVLIWNAVKSGVLVTSLSNLLTTMGFLGAIVASPDFATQDRVLYADVLIFGGVVTSLMIAALFGRLREVTEQLTQANQAKDRLLAMIGHDLRSPFVDMRTALDVLTDEMQHKDFLSIRDHLRLITDQSRWTLENIMEWASLQFDELKRTPAPWIVRTVAWDAFELSRMRAELKGIHVEIGIPEDAVVWVDRQHLSSILRNLISNAVKFTGKGGMVTVSARRLETSWRFSVKDTGKGMSARQMEGIFGDARGFLSRVSASKERGAGLGLWIVGNLVRTNGGTIEVESKEGKGSAFHFTLPVSPE